MQLNKHPNIYSISKLEEEPYEQAIQYDSKAFDVRVVASKMLKSVLC